MSTTGGATLTRADFYASTGTEALFDQAVLTDAQLTFTHLDGASFRDAELSRADFGYSRLKDATFDGATLEDTDFFRSEGSIHFGSADTRHTEFLGSKIKRLKGPAHEPKSRGRTARHYMGDNTLAFYTRQPASQGHVKTNPVRRSMGRSRSRSF